MKGIEQLLLEEEPRVYVVSKVNILDMLFALARLHKAKPKFNLSPQKNANWIWQKQVLGLRS